MRPAGNMEKLVKNVDIDTNAKMDEAVIDDVLKAFEQSKAQKSTAGQPSIWRIIMKSRITKLAAAAVIIGVFGLFLFVGDGQATLYAQVMEAFEEAKTIYAIGYCLEDAQMKKAYELWYQQALGLRTEETYQGKTRTRLKNGRYEWEYLQGNNFAIETESIRKLRLPGELIEPGRYLKECTREPQGDMEFDGFPCRLYAHTDPGDDERPAVKSMLWIDKQMRFRRYEEQKFLDGVWQTVELSTVAYDIPIESRLFTADFGPEIKIIKPQDAIESLFPIKNAIAVKETMGLVFAVHELKRNGSYIFTTVSVRPTTDTRDQIRNYRASGDKPGLEQCGDLYLTSWRQRKENGDLEERPYAHTELGDYQADDVLIRCFASLPMAQWQSVNDKFELSAHIVAMGKVRELLLEKGETPQTEFRVTLPLPAEDTAVEEIALNLYERAKLIAPGKLLRLEPTPANITSEEFALEIEQKLIGLRPMKELWQSKSSNVTLKLVDEGGRPVAGAKIGSDIRSYDGRLYWYYQNAEKDCAISDADGAVVLQAEQVFHPDVPAQSSRMVFAIQEEKHLAGMALVTGQTFGKTITLTMQPACRVFGRFLCPELSDNADVLNRPVDTYLNFFGNKMMYLVFCHRTNKQEFEALLMPGRYEMSCESYDANKKWIARAGQLLVVPKGKRELNLGTIILKLEDYK
jgi:hypothetical protein